MDRSPKGREIEHVEGNPGDIISRGEAITSLGTKMLDSADTLESIKNEAVSDGSQKGKAIEKLKESIGDSYKKLREAGELYEPVGPVIKAYGTALDGCKPTINNSADDCETKWSTYDSLPGDKDGSTTPEAGGGFAGIGGYDKDSPEAKEKAADNGAKSAAYDDWVESAEAFDSGYDTWEDAFDTACDNIGDAMSGKIKDSFWDNFAGFLDVVLTVLSWAALIIGVIAFFAGGWILAAIALGLGALVFAITAAMWLGGKKSLTDVLLSAIAILPVGKLSHLTKLAHFGKLSQAFGKMGALKRIWGAASKGPISKLMTELGKGKAFRFLSKSNITDNLLGPSLKTARAPHIKMYMNGGRDILENNLGSIRNIVKWERRLGIAGTLTGHYGKVATAVNNSGGPNIKLPPWVGVIL